ncbi:MAG: L-seryl-tRNA(Sec) selenium transferase [Bryobacteraceae bacterium]
MASVSESSELRSLPSVDEVLRQLTHLRDLPHALLATEVRSVLAERRNALLNQLPYDVASIPALVESRLRRLLTPSLRRVINATGVVLHTNLGRAPLDELRPIAGYCNLEYDLRAGKRGKRDMHTCPLIERLIGRPAIVVNNNAAAVYLVLRELAAGNEVIVSRGELIEIGDGFRIPEIMWQTGAILREVGTTNRTHVDDYRKAISERTRLILRVHPSNFRQVGFTARPSPAELTALGRETGIPVYEDLGSGCLVDLRDHEIQEPLVSESFDAGINIVSFSCDKLLGGPQSGIIAGDAELVQRVRRNPMYRAMRCDKLAIEALSATLLRLLGEDWNAIPTLRMIFRSADEIRFRAERVAARLGPLHTTVREGESAIGGGSTPDQSLPTWLIEIATSDPDALERKLRRAPVPVIARIERDHVVADLRTVDPREEEDLIAAFQAAAIS